MDRSPPAEITTDDLRKIAEFLYDHLSGTPELSMGLVAAAIQVERIADGLEHGLSLAVALVAP